MAAAFERGLEPDPQDLVGESECDDAPSHREHVRVVVLARQTGRVKIVAQRGADARNLVRGDLLALAASAEDNAAIGAAVGDGATDADANRRIVDGRLTDRPMIVDHMPDPLKDALQMLFQQEAGVIGADSDAHDGRLYYGFRVQRFKGSTVQRFTGSRFNVAMVPGVVISARGEERLTAGHPWIYRADLGDVRAEGGDIVVVRSPRGQVLGRAMYSSASQIALRMLVFGEPSAQDDIAVVRGRLEAAIAFRDSLAIDATAFRLVHAEGDLLPSLIVDRYGEYLVVQALSQGMDRLLPEVIAALNDLLHPRGILARNDPRTRLIEGLEQRVEVLAGEVPETVPVTEGATTYDVDLWKGQKTGLFLDQRENRVAAAGYARGRLLDCFSYHGGFAIPLGRRCETTVAIDASEEALVHLRANAARNGVAIDARAGNVFDELRGMERLRERFDTIVLDPPAFARNKASVAKATTGYKEINLRALKLLNPGGTLITCSCSYNISEAAFAGLIYEAAVDAGVHVTVVEKRMQARDHPVLLGVPETYYLKCFILRKLA
jgi:23S rRNA (cytosine1962-C5)-methyltransferase